MLKIRNRSIRFVSLILALSVFMSGCSILKSGGSDTSDWGSEATALSLDQLEYENFYIMHTDKDNNQTFYVPYVNDKNYQDSNDGGTDSNRTLWFHGDWSQIPTLYSGDSLVMKTYSVLPESIGFERFEYEGATLGISNISESGRGFYYFSNDDDSTNVSYYSDAYDKTSDLVSPEVVIYAINDTKKPKLTANGGLIAGLVPDEKYSCVFRVGSDEFKRSIRADCIALTSTEYLQTYAMKYIDNDLIEINIPTYLNSGYYRVNGSGVFRYVKGTEYDENTDFNIPNDYVVDEEIEGLLDEEEELEEDEFYDEPETFSFDVNEEKETTVTVTYDETDIFGNGIGEPVCKIIGEDAVRTVEKDPDLPQLSGTFNLPIGSYTIEVDGLNGRSVEFTVDN